MVKGRLTKYGRSGRRGQRLQNAWPKGPMPWKGSGEGPGLRTKGVHPLQSPAKALTVVAQLVKVDSRRETRATRELLPKRRGRK